MLRSRHQLKKLVLTTRVSTKIPLVSVLLLGFGNSLTFIVPWVRKSNNTVAETLSVKHQLLIFNRSRKIASNLRRSDRVIAGLR